MTNSETEGKKKAGSPMSVSLSPDASILMQVRIAVGDNRTLKLRDVANLLLHDPVLTMEFLQSANSTMYAGAAVLDLEAALTRIGSQRLKDQLLELNSKEKIVDDEISETMEILRYNSRRVSIVSLIIASATRPTLSAQVRLLGLFAETGHMVALMHMGKKYCELAKANNRKTLPFRLEKDHKLNLENLRSQYLRAKGLPEKMLVPYDLEMELKSSTDVDIRACIRSAIELIEAFDTGKMLTYSPDKPTPSQSNLRLLKVLPVQMEKIYKATSEYLKRISAQEEPEGASLFLQSTQEESSMDLNEGAADQLKVPNYPAVIVKPKSQERIQPLCDLCTEEQNDENLKAKAVQLLTDNNLFLRAALVRIPASGEEAIIETSSGFSEDQPKKISIQDPLSPFKIFRLKIKSYNAGSAKPNAPFGVASFAIGPVAMLPEGERLVLYADTAGAKGLTMDLRGVFRLAMSMLSTRFQKA